MCLMKLFKTIFEFFYNPFTRVAHESWAALIPKSYVKYLYNKLLHKKLNLDNPRDLNEKIQWLKVYSDLSEWTELADKYKVREYVEYCGLGNILVKLYGVWENADEIEFDKLPEKFVIKTNHAFGRAILVKDKSKLEIEKTKTQLNKWLKEKYGLVSFEPHYWNIKRRIIAEEFLQEDFNVAISSSLIDYKFWCFHGEPYLIMVMHDRHNNIIGSEGNANLSQMHTYIYDLDWNLRPEIISGVHLNDNPIVIPKPKCFSEMINICRKLSNPFPQVRVDLYEVNNKIYFGELTFTGKGGYMNSFSDEYLIKMGEKIDLSLAKRRTKRFIV